MQHRHDHRDRQKEQDDGDRAASSGLQHQSGHQDSTPAAEREEAARALSG